MTRPAPKTYGITGAHGQFGWHMRCHFLPFKEDINLKLAGRKTFAKPQNLAGFIARTDAIIHLAGVNRGSDEDVAQGNPHLARTLVSALDAALAQGKLSPLPHIVYASSTHAENDNLYGRSKREAGEILAKWARQNGAPYSELVFPHLFGEHARPFYNSAVSTFCHQLATGEKLSVHGDGQVELLHFQDAARQVSDILKEKRTGIIRMQGTAMSVRDLAERLTDLHESYVQKQIVPDLRDWTQMRLFNTLRAALYDNGYYPVTLKMHTDERGALTETIKSMNGGQSFFSTTKAGITRGNHYHYHKVERFLVLRGQARISIRKLFSDEVHHFDVSGDHQQYIDMPALHTHAITNTGEEELVTLFWAHEIFDPEHPDTVFEPVLA